MNKQELLQLIDQAAIEEWEELDLSGKGVAMLPPEIGKLTRLKKLILGKSLLGDSHKLTTLPPEIGQLFSLTELHLGGNELTAVPPQIGNLSNLTWLDLSNNELTAVPPQIGHLSNLTTLHLSNNRLTGVPPEIGQLSRLTSLGLSFNQLTAVSPAISQLSSLVNLNVGWNRLTTLPPEISQLSRLTTLGLSRNRLTAVPPQIGQLSRLTKLYLSNNQLTALPPEIGRLSKLTALGLSRNQLTALPPEIGQLSSLTELYLGSNQLTAVPPEIGQLSNLIWLDLSSNRLTIISATIGRLFDLTTLNLSNNLITGNLSTLGKLFNLTTLSLSHNRLITLSPQIGKLFNLTKLYLDHNRLTAVPSQIGKLSNLTLFNLGDNQLTTLPRKMRQLTNLKWLNLQDNQLPISPEVLARDGKPDFILNSYFSRQRSLNEAKLLIVGQAGVGKTSLARRLIHDLPPNDQGKTAGVDIHRWHQTINKQDVRLNIWDFGGQEIYHATHQFFLTERSLYLLVINARQGEQEGRLHYWLKLIENLSDDAPIIIIVNQIDGHHLRLDERGLKAKYPNIKAFAYTSCTTGEGIPNLRYVINQTLGQLPHLHNPLPATWFTLKEKLENMPDDYISYDQYVAYCEESGIDEDSDQRTLLRVLHDLGVILNFQEDRRLEDTNVLNPEWVTKGIYAILTSKGVAEQDGILPLHSLGGILPPKSYQRKHHFIIDMMQKFELCYRYEDDPETYLVPDLLPKEQPELNWNEADSLGFEYHYDFLSSGMLARFMVRMKSHIDHRLAWRNGAVLNQEGNQALVKVDQEARKIFIWVTGEKAMRRSLLNSIRTQFSEIHHTSPRLDVAEHIPLPGYPSHTVTYNVLRNHEKRGRYTYYDGELDVEFDVKQLLDSVESSQMRDEWKLQQQLLASFTKEEIKQFCVELGVNYEELGHNLGKTVLARELIMCLARNGRLEELAAHIRQAHAHIAW